jgi:hypothetical protein
MKIALLPEDGLNYPNFALMKIAAYHRARGDAVEFINFLASYDIAYCSKIFTFSPEEKTQINAAQINEGGTGTSIYKSLPQEIEGGEPDYTLYPRFPEAYGFLTRGCTRSCPWCVVPKKEGAIRPYRDIETILQNRKSAVLMDNNVLASAHGIAQMERIAELRCKIDFNQGLDARLVTREIAKLLSKIRWIRVIRFACDTPAQTDSIRAAIDLLKQNGVRPGNIFIYCLVREVEEAYKRILAINEMGALPFAQPYRSLDGKIIPTTEQKHFARFVNRRIFKVCEWKDYSRNTTFPSPTTGQGLTTNTEKKQNVQ